MKLELHAINTIPFETLSPFVTSGIRLGSAALTTRGLNEKDFIEIADIISVSLKNSENEEKQSECKKRVKKLCEKYPMYEKL